jgi:hypothetical protein
MEKGYLAREAERVNKSARKTALLLTVVMLCAVAVIYFLGRDSIDFSDISFGSVPFALLVLIGIFLVSLVIRLIASLRVPMNGEYLVLPYKEDTQDAVGKLIDREALEGNILVDEFIYNFTDEKRAYGDKIVLTHSYLLLCAANNGPAKTSKVTAIPRSKIYWICAQVGRKGGPFVVRLLVFTEEKLFYLDGGNPGHIKNIADKIYQYIPNVLSCYDPFYISYELVDAFKESPETFHHIYEPYARNWASDRDMCAALKQQGDNLTAARETDFFLYFKRESDIDIVEPKLRKQGFTVVSRSTTENGDYGLSLKKDVIPELSYVNQITSGILSVLGGVDAVFDGWGCNVVKE